MKIYILILLSVSSISCVQESPKIKHVKNLTLKKDLTGISVVNSEDPVCSMKTAEYLKDTAVYKGKSYGFCSGHCKSEFKLNPQKYVKK